MPQSSRKYMPAGFATRYAASRLRSGIRSIAVVLVVSLLLTTGCATATSKKKDPSYLRSTVASSGGAYTLYTVTSCGECTVNLSQRWCPSTMHCYPASNCTCDGPVPCMDLRTCFYGTRPSCRECVDSGGVYCAGGASAQTLRSGHSAPDARCYPPEGRPSPVATAADVADGSKGSAEVSTRGAGLLALLPTCGVSTCQGGRCVRFAGDCPAEVSNSLMRSYEAISAVVVLLLSALAIHSIFRLVL